MWEPIDAYCERLDASFWAEPVNALTNAAFLLAALVTGRRAARAGDGGAGLLALVLGIIGIGSFLFHTFAVRWAAIADVLPILAFILLYVWLAGRRFLGLSPLAAGLLVLLYPPASAATAWAVRAATGGLGGSEGYLGVLLYIAAFALALAPRHPATARGLLAGGAIFAVSLAARTLDRPLCDLLPLGTHFLWHLLNALMLGWMIGVLLAHGRAVATPGPAR